MKRNSASFLLLLLTAAAILSCWILMAHIAFVVVMVIICLFMMVIGMVTSNRPLGFLISENYVMSLSRVQLSAWTILVLAAYLVAALKRVLAPEIDAPLDIAIDWKVWTLLGISTASFVGSPMVLSRKKAKTPADEAVKKAEPEIANIVAKPAGAEKGVVESNRAGTVFKYPDPSYTVFYDIFEGDEVGNTLTVDIAKVQMFFFTVIAVFSYAVAVYQMLYSGEPENFATFPVPSEGLVWILGISHAGYLGAKAVDHTDLKKPEEKEP